MVKRGLILEYIVGGGLMQVDSNLIGPSFRNEGWTMLSMLAEDWARCRSQGEVWEVIAPIDPRLSDWFSIPANQIFRPLDCTQDFLGQWCRLAVNADAIILIAPESGGELVRLSAEIDEVSDARLGCRSPFLERASNKLMMAEYISDEYLHPQTLTPIQFQAYVRADIDSSQREWVIKPIDGAGCDGIYRGSANAILTHLQQNSGCQGSLIQHYLPGHPASVAAWVTESGRWWLPPVWQDIHWEQTTISDGIELDHPTYRGGSGPIEQAYWPTIHKFADRILDLLGPGALGWVGIDFVLNVENGIAHCSAIEVNPRWTTSYAGLRKLYQGNLLEKFLEITNKPFAGSKIANTECWTPQSVNWSASPPP